MCGSVGPAHSRAMRSEGITTGYPLARAPRRLDMARFAGTTSPLRRRRLAVEARGGQSARRLAPGASMRGGPVAARVSSPLWIGLTGGKEHALTAGKIHNLRLALRTIDGTEVKAGEVFSFWKQVGRTTRR